eukprot:3996102-Pyramimonas_sp.AAC.1
MDAHPPPAPPATAAATAAATEADVGVGCYAERRLKGQRGRGRGEDGYAMTSRGRLDPAVFLPASMPDASRRRSRVAGPWAP